MGYAVAEAAAQRGAKVILISGPTTLETPAGVTRVDVRTASQMLRAVEDHFAQATTAIFAAAVADYRPVDVASQKIKKSAGEMTLRLEPNPDNIVTLFARDGRDLPLPKMTKREVAHRILDEVLRLTASVKHQSAD